MSKQVIASLWCFHSRTFIRSLLFLSFFRDGGRDGIWFWMLISYPLDFLWVWMHSKFQIMTSLMVRLVSIVFEIRFLLLTVPSASNQKFVMRSGKNGGDHVYNRNPVNNGPYLWFQSNNGLTIPIKFLAQLGRMDVMDVDFTITFNEEA